MNKLIVSLALVMTSGCTVLPMVDRPMNAVVVGQPVGGYVSGVVVPPFSRVMVYTPPVALDYLSQDYYFYGPTVSVIRPSMIYGNGWRGRGFYHSRPFRRY